MGTLIGWTKHNDKVDIATCKPRKLGLPILGYNECIKTGIDPIYFNNDYGCIGVVNTNSLVCAVSELYLLYYNFIKYGNI